MHSERDYLRMFVFPQINDELKKYAISMRIIDLRWGINTMEQSQEATESKVMRVCFNEIDRSRPFFIGLLGCRYGWIPPSSSSYMLHGKRFEEESSITSMEIEYAILQEKGISGCLFMERDASCLDKMEDSVREKYDDSFSTNEKTRTENPQRLRLLKQRIKQHLHEKGKDYCYQQYCPTWNGKEFDSLSAFGEIVKRTMLHEIASIYSLDYNDEPFKEELNSQKQFLYFKLAKVYDRKAVTEGLVEKIRINKGVLVISGLSGTGKSCIYALLVSHFLQQQDKYVVLYHSTSVGMRSRESLLMLTRWIYQLETEYQLPHITCNTGKDAVTYFGNLIKKTPKTKKLVLFIDATDGFLKSPYTDYLSFSPRSLHEQWLIICTTTPECTEKIAQYHRSMENYALPPLSDIEAKAIIDRFYHYNSKELCPQNLEKLLERQHNGTPCYASPLWLNIALNRLLSFNEQDFSQIASANIDFNQGFIDYVNKQIDSFPAKEEELFKLFLLSLQKFYSILPVRLFHLLSVSYKGLHEDTIATLMGDEWSPLTFAIIRNYFYDFLAEQGNQKTWQIMHQKCRQRISDEDEMRICRQIACYYIEKLEQGGVVNDNLCYYLIKSHDTDLANRYFRLFYKEKERIQHEILQACEILNHQDILNFLLKLYSNSGKSRLIPKSYLFWELKEVVVNIASMFNKTGKHEDAMLYIDSFYEFISEQRFSKDVRSILFILTEPERERAASYVLNREEQIVAYQQAINRATISGPLSLILAPIARKFYKWQSFKLLNK